jgi:hypothetical protein
VEPVGEVVEPGALDGAAVVGAAVDGALVPGPEVGAAVVGTAVVGAGAVGWAAVSCAAAAAWSGVAPARRPAGRKVKARAAASTPRIRNGSRGRARRPPRARGSRAELGVDT